MRYYLTTKGDEVRASLVINENFPGKIIADIGSQTSLDYDTVKGINDAAFKAAVPYKGSKDFGARYALVVLQAIQGRCTTTELIARSEKISKQTLSTPATEKDTKGSLLDSLTEAFLPLFQNSEKSGLLAQRSEIPPSPTCSFGLTEEEFGEVTNRSLASICYKSRQKVKGKYSDSPRTAARELAERVINSVVEFRPQRRSIQTANSEISVPTGKRSAEYNGTAATSKKPQSVSARNDSAHATAGDTTDDEVPENWEEVA